MYRKSPISAVPWGKDKTALIESALIEFSNKSHEIRGKMAKKSTFLDNYACFQNRTIAKSALIETALSGDSLYVFFICICLSQGCKTAKQRLSNG